RPLTVPRVSLKFPGVGITGGRMRSNVVGRLVLIAAILLLPARLTAQEATLTGTVADFTGGVLPGVTVTALHEATGNTFVAVTDERGIYRIPARVGSYRINAVLQ